MMYLEDYTESIETLPQDMKHYYSHMRTLDLRVSTAYDNVHKKFQKLCAAAPKLAPGAIEAAYSEIQKDFSGVFEQAEEKVQLAEQTWDILDKQIRRLDVEIKKFRSDLEAKQPGITATLAEQSLELDRPGTPEVERERPRRPAGRPPRVASAQRTASSHASSAPDGATTAMPVANVVDVNAWNAASLQPSSKFDLSGLATGKQLVVAAVTAMGSNASHNSSSVPMQVEMPHAAVSDTPSATGAPVDGPPEFSDPNEPRYCYCKQVSFGEMVGCDNDDCESGEWFHYKCVGLTEEPKGKWYCFECRIKMEGMY